MFTLQPLPENVNDPEVKWPVQSYRTGKRQSWHFSLAFLLTFYRKGWGGLKGPRWEWVVWPGEPVWWGREEGKVNLSVPASCGVVERTGTEDPDNWRSSGKRGSLKPLQQCPCLPGSAFLGQRKTNHPWRLEWVQRALVLPGKMGLTQACRFPFVLVYLTL